MNIFSCEVSTFIVSHDIAIKEVTLKTYFNIMHYKIYCSDKICTYVAGYHLYT